MSFSSPLTSSFLVGALEPWNFMTFQKQLGMSFHPNWRTQWFFRGVGIPPTRFDLCCWHNFDPSPSDLQLAVQPKRASATRGGCETQTWTGQSHGRPMQNWDVKVIIYIYIWYHRYRKSLGNIMEIAAMIHVQCDFPWSFFPMNFPWSRCWGAWPCYRNPCTSSRGENMSCRTAMIKKPSIHSDERGL